MKKINFNDLQPEQQQELLAQAAEQNRKKEEAIKAERDTYKALASEQVDNIFGYLLDVSTLLASAKKKIYDDFEAVTKLKCEVYNIDPEKQLSHTFSNEKGDKRIRLGYYVNDNYDDTANAGIEKVREYLASLADNDKAKRLVSIISKLLARDNEGNLKASRVMLLQKHAKESGDAAFIDGVAIIHQAYKPIKSKLYVKAEYKDSKTNEWVSVPLSMTEVNKPKDKKEKEEDTQ